MFRRSLSAAARRLQCKSLTALSPSYNAAAAGARRAPLEVGALGKGKRYYSSPYRPTLWQRVDGAPTEVLGGLILANVGVWTLWQYADRRWMAEHFTVSGRSLREGRLHTLVTSAFSQVDAWHLGGNMLSLFFFGARWRGVPWKQHSDSCGAFLQGAKLVSSLAACVSLACTWCLAWQAAWRT